MDRQQASVRAFGLLCLVGFFLYCQYYWDCSLGSAVAAAGLLVVLARYLNSRAVIRAVLARVRPDQPLHLVREPASANSGQKEDELILQRVQLTDLNQVSLDAALVPTLLLWVSFVHGDDAHRLRFPLSSKPVDQWYDGTHGLRTVVCLLDDAAAPGSAKLQLQVLTNDTRVLVSGSFTFVFGGHEFSICLMKGAVTSKTANSQDCVEMEKTLECNISSSQFSKPPRTLHLFAATAWDQPLTRDKLDTLTLNVKPDQRHSFDLHATKACHLLRTRHHDQLFSHRGGWVACCALLSQRAGASTTVQGRELTDLRFLYLLYSPVRTRLLLLGTKLSIQAADLECFVRKLLVGSPDMTEGKSPLFSRFAPVFVFNGQVNPSLVGIDRLGPPGSTYLRMKPTMHLFRDGPVQATLSFGQTNKQ